MRLPLQAGMVCESNHISGRKQKPAGNREEVLTNIFCWNPFPSGDGGCQNTAMKRLAWVNASATIARFYPCGLLRDAR